MTKEILGRTLRHSHWQMACEPPESGRCTAIFFLLVVPGDQVPVSFLRSAIRSTNKITTALCRIIQESSPGHQLHYFKSQSEVHMVEMVLR